MKIYGVKGKETKMRSQQIQWVNSSACFGLQMVMEGQVETSESSDAES